MNRRFTIPVLIFAPLVHLASVCTPTLPHDSLKSYSQAKYTRADIASLFPTTAIPLFLHFIYPLLTRWDKNRNVNRKMNDDSINERYLRRLATVLVRGNEVSRGGNAIINSRKIGLRSLRSLVTGEFTSQWIPVGFQVLTILRHRRPSSVWTTTLLFFIEHRLRY